MNDLCHLLIYIVVLSEGMNDTWFVASMLFSYVTGMELVPGFALGQLPIDTPESVRELLDALISGNFSASFALDLTFCSGDIVKEMIAARQLVQDAHKPIIYASLINALSLEFHLMVESIKCNRSYKISIVALMTS